MRLGYTHNPCSKLVDIGHRFPLLQILLIAEQNGAFICESKTKSYIRRITELFMLYRACVKLLERVEGQ